jgi:hypothetical protein
MSTKEYNGWTNKQTWRVYNIHDNLLKKIATSSSCTDADHMQYVLENTIIDRELETLQEGTVAYEAACEYLEAVNWREIAEAYFVQYLQAVL